MRARQAYIGQAFRLSVRALEARAARWCILSGWYGFLWPDTFIQHYDYKLQPADVTPSGLSAWEPFEALKQKQYGRLRSARSIVVLGSRLYAAAAEQLLQQPVAAPLAGLSIGQMLHTLSTGIPSHL